jgi:glycerol-3-phosphate cytidylyltransferase|tara:strand:+ start:472 stop:894 length:423 start_codon:yes stop_codon:yes gene_type:complete
MNIGIIAGNFDVIHPGYIAMFKECKSNCDKFIVLLHTDPSIERPHKLKPILNVQDRIEMLNCFEQIDDVVTYTTEAELYDIIADRKAQIKVRFLGNDYKDKEFTGKDLNIPIHYINRDHGWSTTKFKKLIANEVLSSSNV